MHFDWRIRLVVSIALMGGTAYLVYLGFGLRSLGQKFSHVWTAAAVTGWGSAHLLQKAFEDKP